MKKVLLCLMITLFIVGSVYAALTVTEKKMLKEIYVYYSGNIPGAEANEAVRDLILEGTEAQRKIIIKSYLTDIRIPQAQSTLTRIEVAVTDLTSEIQTMQNWVAAN